MTNSSGQASQRELGDPRFDIGASSVVHGTLGVADNETPQAPTRRGNPDAVSPFLRRIHFFRGAGALMENYVRAHMSTLTSNRSALQPDYKAFYCRILVATDPSRIFASTQHGVIPGSSQTKARGISSPGRYEKPAHVASQRWRAAMEHYVGLDVSLKLTSICVVNQTGSIVQEGVVDSDPEAIASFVRLKAPGTVRIGIETGPTTTWLWTELNRLRLPVISIASRAICNSSRRKPDCRRAPRWIPLERACPPQASGNCTPSWRCFLQLSH
jgi:hypothetical protein